MRRIDPQESGHLAPVRGETLDSLVDIVERRSYAAQQPEARFR